MIQISRAEWAEILKVFPKAEIHSTRHHFYLVTSRDAIDALNRIRRLHPAPLYSRKGKRAFTPWGIDTPPRQSEGRERA